MKKFHQWLVGISLVGMLLSGIASASFTGSSPMGVSAADLLDYAKLAVTNIFTKDQTINDPEVLAGGTFSGIRVQTTERASYCLGPSDGSSSEFCMSGGNTLMLHGSSAALYDQTSTGNVTLLSDSVQNRHWFAPTGSFVVAGGQQPPIESAFMVGSNLNNAATFLADTTNDWIKVLPISAPAATECDEADERGRIYYDSGTDKLKYCNGTAWTDL